MEQSPGEEYEKFLDFCSVSLKGENPKFLDLIKSRYAACDERFRCSGEMVKLLGKTQRNMASEDSRKFVHLKEFLTKLKINTAAQWKKKKKKRKHSSDSETEATHLTKVPKLKDCSVVVTKFPGDDLALFACDAVVDDESNSTELHMKKSCSIADGDVNGALSILVADDEQVILLKDELGSAIDYSDSPTPLPQYSEPSFSGRVESCGKEAVEQRANIFDSRSSSPHIPFSTRGISSRKPVVYLDIDDDEFAEEDDIEIGSTDSNDNDNHLVSTIFAAEESEKWQTENDKSLDIQTSPNEPALNGVSITNKPPRTKSTFIVDVKLSDSPDVLVILPSSSCQKLMEFSEIKSINSRTEHQENTHDTLTMCNEKDRIHNIRLDTISDDAIPSTSAHEDKENTSSISFEDVLEKTPILESVEHSPLSSLTTSVESPTIVSFQNTALIELEDGHDDVGKDSLPCEETIPENQKVVENQDTSMSEVIKENQTVGENLYTSTSEVIEENKKGVKNLETLTSEVKESLKCNQDLGAVSEVKSNVDKLMKRVPLLSVTKDTTSSSGSFGVKPSLSSFSKQERATQKPSSSSETKVVPSSVEARPPESGDSADEFQKAGTDHIVDKSQLKQKRRVAKLEHLLESLRDEIEKCQDAEMTLDDLDDDNAAYIYEDKLKRKFVAVWNKLCEVTGRTITTGRPTEKRVRYSGTRYQEINRRIEKFLNKKKVFPDFHDIRSIVKLTNKKCNLNLSVMMSNDIAREAFVDIGEMLQTRRHQDFIATFGTRQTDVLRGSLDPYLTDPEFRRKVDTNRQVAKCNLDNIIAKYTKLQKERLYGEDGEEPEEESDEDEDSISRKTDSEKPEKDKDVASRSATEDVTAESIEVDMAEESDDEMTNCSSSATCDASEQPPTKYRPSSVALGRSTYLLTPDKSKSITKRLVDSDKSADQPLDASSSVDRPELATLGRKDDGSSCSAESIIVIDESPAKSQQELGKSPFEVKLNPFNLDKQSQVKAADSEKGNQPVKDVTAADRRGPNIKFTARKPLHPESAGSSNMLASDDMEKSKFDGFREDLKSRMSSVCEIFDDEDEDQSSDSSSEQDADDKLVDDDVDEIVMITNRSDSECDTVSTRDPSPISVVSLSSESLDDMTDNWETDSPAPVESATRLPGSSTVELVTSPKPPNKHSQIQKDDDFEQRQFMEAMGIRKSENSAAVSCSLDDKVLNDKNKDTLICHEIEGEITTTKQKYALTYVELTSTDRQQKNHIAESPLRDRRTSPVNRFSQDSDDCIIIQDIRSTNEVGDTEQANLVARVGESHKSNKKTFDFQLPSSEFCTAGNNQVRLTSSPANKSAGGSTTEKHQGLNVHGKQVPETDEKMLASKESAEMFSQAAARNDFARASAEQSGSGIAEKLHSLNSLLQRISGSTTDSCMLQDLSTDGANSHGNFPQEAPEDQTETTEVNVSESSTGAGTSKSPGMEDNNICMVDGDMSNDSSQTGIHIMDVCSIMLEPGSTSDGQNQDALSAPNTGDCLNKTISSHSDAVKSRSAARNKAATFSVKGDSCYQDPSSLPRSSSVLSDHDLPLCVSPKSTDNKYNSRNSTVKAKEPSSLFQTSISAGLTDGDSQDSCIEIIEAFDEDVEEICDSDSTSAYPQSGQFKRKSDNSFCKPQNKTADTTANHTAVKEAKVRQSIAGEKKFVRGPSTDNCQASNSRSLQIKSSPAGKNLNREGPGDAIVIDLCESSSVRVICSEHTKAEAASVTKLEVNVNVESMRQRHIVEDKASNYSSQTEIIIVESPELFEYNNTSIEIPKQVKDNNISIETPKQVKDKNASVETPKEVKGKNASVETLKQVKDKNASVEISKDKCENTGIEIPKQVKDNNASIETSKQVKDKNISIETPKQVKDKNTSIETPKDENTSLETPKDENTCLETPNKVDLENINKLSCGEKVSESLLNSPERTNLKDVAEPAADAIPHIDNSVHQNTLQDSIDSRCVNSDLARECSNHGPGSAVGKPFVEQERDSVLCEGDGNIEDNVQTNRTGNIGDNIDSDTVGHNEQNINNSSDRENVHMDRMGDIESNVHTSTTGNKEGNVHNVEKERGNVHNIEKERGNAHNVEKERGNAHNVEKERGNVHSVEKERGNVHNVEKERGNVHNIEKERGNVHSVEKERGNVHNIEKERGNVHNIEKERGNVHNIEKERGNVHLDTIGNIAGTVDSDGNRIDNNEEHLRTNVGETHCRNVHRSSNNAGNVHIDSFKNNEENVLSIGSDTEIVHIGDDDDGENVHPKSVGSVERNVHNNSVGCDDKNVHSISNDAQNISSEKIGNTGSVGDERGSVDTDTVGNNDTGINEGYVQVSVGANVQADGVENNGEHCVGINEKKVAVSTGTNVQADDVGNNGENVQMDDVGINVENVHAEVVGNNMENVQMDNVGNNAENVQTDDIGENFQMSDDGNNGENICVNSVGNNGGNGSRATDEIKKGKELMDSTSEDKSSTLCEDITEGENGSFCDSHRNDNDGESHDTDVQVAQLEKCVDEGVGQIVENERNRMDLGEIVQRSDNDSNKASQCLEVEGETGDDDSVDLLSTDSPNWDVEEGGSQDAQSRAIKEIGKVAESAGLEIDGGEDRVSKQKDLDAYRGDGCTEGKGLDVDNEDRQKGQEDLDANNIGGHAEKKDLNADIGNEHTIVQEDLTVNSGDELTLGQGGFDGDGRTSKQLNVDAKSGDGCISTESDFDTNRGDGNTEQKDLKKHNKGEPTSKRGDLNTDVEGSISDDQESSPIVLDYQSVRSLDTAIIQAEECSRDASENDAVTESTKNSAEKLAESTLSDKTKYSSNILRCDVDEEETVADGDDDNSCELASLRECKGNEDSKNEEKSGPLAKNAERDESSKHVGSSSVDDEDEIKIIEELSSVKGVRHSDNSKEEDRRLVDQLLLDIGLSTAKEPKLATESTDTVLTDEPGKYSDVCEEVETEQSVCEPGDPAEKSSPEQDSNSSPEKDSNSPPEKDSNSRSTNSLCHTSVLSVECEEVDEGEVSPPASCVQDVDSVELQLTVKNRKRPYGDTGSELQGDGKEEQNSEEKDLTVSSSASTAVIDVEMLPQIKKPKVVDHGLINDVISSVLAEFPLSGSARKFPTSKVKQSQPTDSKTTEVPELVVGDDDDDDDVVVIMEESSTETGKPPIVPVALHKNRSHGSTAFRQQSSLGRGSQSAASLPFRKHPAMQTYGNPNRAAQNLPSTSFQPPPQMSSSNGRRFSFAPRTRSPGFIRTKYLASTAITGQNRALPGERGLTSQTLPRLSPRVPIPSIQPDRASELTRTPPKPLPGTSASFVNKRFQSPTSSHIRSPAPGHMRSPTAGNIRSPTVGQTRSPNVGHIRSPTLGHSGNTFRPNLPAMSFSRKRPHTSSMPPLPSNNLSSGVALRGSGRPTSYPKQPPLGALHNTARQQPQNLVPPQRLQPQQLHHGSKSNSRPKQHGVASRVEIILGDSDDEGEFTNASSGPRIVSVSSLSTSANSDTTSSNPSRVPSSRTEAQPHRPNRDVIVIPD